MSLNSLKTVYIVGVCGTLMGAFATFLKRSGVRVIGSDQNVYPPMSDVLSKANVELLSGYTAEHVSGLGFKPDLFVVGNVIRADNPEVLEAKKLGIKLTSLPEAMEQLFLPHTHNIVVAGTHGKTTTSSMMAHVLLQLGKAPSYFVGGVPADLPYSFNVEKIDPSHRGFFVLEGDEYDTAFWDKVPKFNHYLPNDAFLTSVEFDHADIYANLEAVERAFDGLLSRIRDQGTLLACGEYESVRKIVERALKNKVLKADQVYWYGFEEKMNEAKDFVRIHGGKIFTLSQFNETEAFASFRVLDQEIKIRVPGRHNALNAAAVWIEANNLRLDQSQVLKALSSFGGVKRRQEVRAEIAGKTVIDDFAHHPTAVKETLRALKERYKGRKLVAVFEPRSATSRRKVFQKEYAVAFDIADEVFIAKPYDQSRISAEEQFSSQELVHSISERGKAAHLFESVDTVVKSIAQSSKPGDVFAILSNGGFDGMIPKLIDELKQQKS